MRVIEELAPLVGIMAAERTRDRPDLFDDARQEGLIAAWLVSEKQPDASPAYVHTVARRAVGDVLRGRPAFGAERRRGWRDAHNGADSLEREDGKYVIDPGAHDAGMEAVEHRDHIAQAVRSLDPVARRYVFLRFWHGMTVAEVAAEMGVKPRSLEDLWRRIRPELMEAVA